MDRNLEERRPVNLQDRVYAIATARRGLRSARCNTSSLPCPCPCASASQRTSSGTCCCSFPRTPVRLLLQSYEPVSEHAPTTWPTASPTSTSHHIGLDGPKGCRWMMGSMGIGSPRRRSPGAHYQNARTAACYCSRKLSQVATQSRGENPEFQADGSPWSVTIGPAHAACVIARH